jgi:hypothetical protein
MGIRRREMLTPTQIKKLIKIAKPEGFEYIELNPDKFPHPINHPFAVVWHEDINIIRCAREFNDSNMVQYFLSEKTYSLFLQRCIEGINRANPEYIQIAQCGYSVQVLTDGNRDVLLNIYLTHRNNISIDQAKEQALIYILEELEI